MNKKILVFYDAQNINNVNDLSLVENAIKKYGDIAAVRIYHDFIGKDNKWKLICYNKGYMPCQITKPKNNTADLLISIDAMKFASISNNEIFCFVSNDSDFGPVSIALREIGKETLLVTSLKNTSLSNYFTFTESFKVNGTNAITETSTTSKQLNSLSQEKQKSPVPSIDINEIKAYLLKYYNSAKKDNEKWASYASLCSSLAKKYKDLDFKGLGFKNKKDLISSFGFEIEGSNIRKKI